MILQKIWHNFYFKLAVALVWLGTVWLLLETSLPSLALPGADIPNLDKLVHLAMFGVLTLLLWRLFKMFIHRRWLRLVLPALASMLYAGATEYFQQFVPTRNLSIADLLAGWIGVALALALIYWQRERKPSLLVHLCCGPCAAGVMRALKRQYFPALLFANSNIDTPEEYAARYRAAKQLADFYGIPLIKSRYGHDDWLALIKGHESAPEKGSRCLLCYRYRMAETAATACKFSFDYFATSLTTSPYKNREAIMSIGQELEQEYSVKFLDANFGAGSGYQDSIKASKELGLYRQKYCGCEFSRRG